MVTPALYDEKNRDRLGVQRSDTRAPILWIGGLRKREQLESLPKNSPGKVLKAELQTVAVTQ